MPGSRERGCGRARLGSFGCGSLVTPGGAVLDAAQAEREVTDEDLSAALMEMLSDAHTITRSMLGSTPNHDVEGPSSADEAEPA